MISKFVSFLPLFVLLCNYKGPSVYYICLVVSILLSEINIHIIYEYSQLTKLLSISNSGASKNVRNNI